MITTTHSILLVLLFAGFFLSRRWMLNLIDQIAEHKHAPLHRKLMVRQILQISHTLAFIILASLVLGIDYGKFVVFLSSAFAILGVALFAQWSILSNLTAGVVIFFKFPYRIGDYIRIANKDFDLCGMIEEITSFHVLLRHANGELITYPNNLLLQTAVIKLNPPPPAVNLVSHDDSPKKPQPESD